VRRWRGHEQYFDREEGREGGEGWVGGGGGCGGGTIEIEEKMITNKTEGREKRGQEGRTSNMR